MSSLTFDSLSFSLPSVPSVPLCLLPPGPTYVGPSVIAPRSVGSIQFPVESVGIVFHRLFLSRFGMSSSVSASLSVSQSVEKEKEKGTEKEKGGRKKTGTHEAAWKKIKWHSIKEEIDENDYYALLCLPDRMASTEEEIRLRHKKLCLLYHPDKALPEDRERTEQRFKKITQAYETLTDPVKRRQYEATLEFDDSFPDGDEATDFFEEWGPVFKRNARFSVIVPVPELGTEETDLEEVKKFYDFWYAFKSWRDFKVEKDHNLEKAESREERRWMEKENDKLRAPKRKEEAARIRKMVELAEKLDPRIARQKRLEKQKRLQEKQSRENAKLAKAKEIEDQKRLEKEKIEAEKAILAAEAAKIKAVKDGEKNIQKKVRSSLRKYITAANAITEDQVVASDDDIDFFSRNVALSDTVRLISIFHAALPEVLPLQYGGPSTVMTVPVPDFSNEEKMERLELVLKATSLFHELYRAKRTPKELEAIDTAAKISQAKLEAERAKTLHVKKVIKFWTRDELSELARACKMYPAGTQQRWQVIAEFLGGDRSEEEIIKKARELSENSEVRPQDAFAQFQAHRKEPIAGLTENVVTSKEEDKEAPVVATGSEDTWTAEHQLLLEAALKKHPASDSGRWENIAKDVGKTKESCHKRFKEIRAKLQESKK